MKLRSFLCLALGLCCVSCSQENPNIFEPNTLSDSAGNSADRNSTISWADIPAGKTYKTSTEYDDGGLGPLFNFARSFIHTVQPNDLPYDLIEGIMDGSKSIGDNYMDLVMYCLGFAICFVIGILFIIIFPIVGCCLCCCRCCCNNCGGKMMQKQDDKTNCKRIAFSITLLILTLFMGAGAACVYASAGRISTAIDNLDEAVDTNLDDVSTFVDNLVDGLDYVAGDNYNFTVEVVSRDLDNIGYLLGVPVKNKLVVSGGLDSALSSMLAFQTDIDTLGTSLYAVNGSVASLKTNGDQLKNNLTAVRALIIAAKAEGADCVGCAPIDENQLVMEVDFDNLPDITSQLDKLDEVNQKNLTALVIKGKEEFENVPERVQNKTKTVVEDTKDMLNSFSSTINSQISSVKDMPADILKQLDTIKSDFDGYIKTAKEYDKYRWYAGLGLACIILLVAMLQLLGLLFGCFGHRKEALPTERSCLSNSGGNMLMAATGFIFIFSILLMLLTTICFLIGGNMEILLCDTLNDPQYKTMKQLIDGPGGLLAEDGEYFLGKTILKNASVPLQISSMLENCKNNKAAYSALQLQNLFDLDSVVDYKSAIDIDSEMNKVNVDLSEIEFLSADTEDQLRDFSESTQLDYDGFKDELSKNTTQVSLSDFASVLAAAASASSNTAKTKLQEAADELNAINVGIYATVKSDQDQVYTDIVDLEAGTSAIPASVNNTIDTAKDAEQFIQINGSSLIKDEAKLYGNRLVGVADSFAAATLNAVKNDIGKCIPVWNLWESMFGIALCKYTIDAFNGFWFAIGWSIFFMVPSVIFNIKLAKHFRQMKYIDGFDTLETRDPRAERYSKSAEPDADDTKIAQRGDNTRPSSSGNSSPAQQPRLERPPSIGQNKVGHYDGQWDSKTYDRS